jgi:hypothetical protein
MSNLVHRRLIEQVLPMRLSAGFKSIWALAAEKIPPVTALVVLVGIVLRISAWMIDRNLWLDEVRIAANILDRSWLGLLAPLDFSQSAPIFFLFSVKACIAVFGLSEQSFRLVPLLASVVQLILFWRLSARILPPLATLVAVAFCAFSERLLYFSMELKQYGTESLVTTLLIYLALRWFDEPESKRARWLLAGGGVIGILFSHTTVFVFAGVVGAALSLPSVQRSKLFTAGNYLLFGICWVPLFLANYHWVIAGNYQDELMINYWASTYPGLPLGMDDWARWVGLLRGSIRYHDLPMRTIQVLIILGVPGFLWLVRKRDVNLLIVILPIVLYWAAGIAHKAPFYGRLLICIYPAVILAFAVSLSESCRLAGCTRWGRALPIGCLLLALHALGRQFKGLPQVVEQNTAVDALAQVKRDALPGDVLYVSNYAVSTHRVYAKFMPYPAGLAVVEGRRKVTWRTVAFEPAKATIDRGTIMADLKQLNPEAKRFWLVLNRFRELRETLPQDLRTIWGDDVSLLWQRENTDFYLVKPSVPATPTVGP